MSDSEAAPFEAAPQVARPGTTTGRDARGTPARTRWWVNALWVAVGIVSGLGIVLGLGAEGDAAGGSPAETTTAAVPATAVGVAAVCYLAAAATGRRWAGWAMVPVASVLPFLEYAGVPRWASFGVVGLALLVYGLARRRPTTLAQGFAMVAYYGVAVAAVAMPPRVGLVVAALALAAHVAWDLVHYRRDVVVHRSLAVWCVGLDLTVAALCVTFAVA
ncbi:MULTISPECIES: hypothetical protein [unclassified Isoptericola]|uniref:hypothetical protein n=1 Tax=unclassified Isoptericola TaxID=2623355 RepID=UPI003661DF2C